MKNGRIGIRRKFRITEECAAKSPANGLRRRIFPKPAAQASSPDRAGCGRDSIGARRRFRFTGAKPSAKKTLDCGALAAIAHEVFTARGVKSYRIQIVQKFSEVATKQWTSSWNETNGQQLPWTHNDLIYHEGCAIAVGEREVKVWDASAGWWINANSGDGYGSLTAIRLSANEAGATFDWERHRLVANQWQKLS